MRGGKFNHNKYRGYFRLMRLLYLLKIATIYEEYMPTPNPLDKAQKLFVEPFDG